MPLRLPAYLCVATRMNLWASFVQVGEVDADAPLSILFLYNDNIGKSFRVLNFSYGTNVNEFLDLVVNDFVLLGCELSSFLFNWLIF